jgi:hypothetical protein
MKMLDHINDAPGQAAEINICRPGYGASCGLCCGSHNFDCTREDLIHLMKRRASRLSSFAPEYLRGTVRRSRSGLTGSIYFPLRNFLSDEPPPLAARSPQCPFLVTDASTNYIECMLNPEAHLDGKTVDCALSYRGKVFLCPAREKLSVREFRYAAQFAEDWFFYSLVIQHDRMLGRMMRRWNDPGAINTLERKKIESELEDFRTSRMDIHELDTYFGVPR